MSAQLLIVDDERINRAFLRAMLRAEGYRVLEAQDGAEALDLFVREPIDLVLLDVLMPGLGGLEVCRRVKAAARGFVPVILLTGLAEQADRNAGLEAGADDFVTKPFDRRELLLRVRALVRLRLQELRIVEQEGALRQQLQEVTRLQALKDELFSLIVHDIRNPLTGLMGFAELLRLKLRERADPLAEYADQALGAARKVEELLATVLEVQMLESGVVPMQRAPTHLRELVADAIASLEGAACATDITIDLKPGEDLEVAVDPRFMRRSVENLLANAIKYSPSKGTIEVSVAGDGSTAEVAVADQGPGVPDQLKRTLFQKFGSVEAEGGRQRRGHGLGLHLVKLVASAHAGTVQALDRESGGTTFVLRFASN